MGAELLTVAEMYAADRAAMAAGLSGPELMEAAGAAVAAAIRDRWPPGAVTILCGPGNNGGDGFVAARYLVAEGWDVTLALLGRRDDLTGDAAWAAGTWDGPVAPATADALRGADLIVDALFGAGLSRPLEGDALALVAAMDAHPAPVVAVDMPSGVRGDDGGIQGAAVKAAMTVTFFRRKPGHLLLPGRLHCGTVEVADIGIPPEVLEGIAPRLAENGPSLWGRRYPWPRADAHKYARGHAVVLGGPVMTGAARLAARGALRAGAGVVTVAAAPETFTVYALSMPTVIVQPVADADAFAALLDDPRRNAVLLGPGAGVGPALRAAVRAAVDRGRAGVLDADVFAAFADDPAALFDGLSERWLLTPHTGEFARLFPGLEGGRLDKARAAAARCGAPVLLKGPDTVIAHPDGRAVINANATPDLATAGSGDVLAGFALGLIAQGVPAFDAGCMAAWLHGAVGRALGPGLIAEDLPEALPPVLRWLKEIAG